MSKAKIRDFMLLQALLCAPACASVQILFLSPSHASPQPIGKTITWHVNATDTNAGPLTFQFNVAPPNGTLQVVKDFNVGTLNSGTWASQPFVWVPTGIEGQYEIEVVAKDFTTGETAIRRAKFQVDPVVTGTNPAIVKTPNPLVVLFSAPSCASGSSMRVSYQQQSLSTPANFTNWVSCHPPNTMTFEVAGMYPSTEYVMYPQVTTAGKTVNGPSIYYTTGALPTNISFPKFKSVVPPGPQTDTQAPIILHNLIQLGGGTTYPDVATDLSGNIIWYYYPNDLNHFNVLARPLMNGGFLSIEDDYAWNPAASNGQVLRQLDLAGNIVRETNTGIIQQQLVLMGAAGAGSCSAIAVPPPVGAGCLGAFHHDAIQTLPNGYTAVIGDLEKIFPPGTQGDTSGLPVDIIGDIIVALDTNWQVVWYFDSFQHARGAPQLDIHRPAVLGETCVTGQSGCPPIFLLSSGTAPKAYDWLHANSLYYWPQQHDIIWSSRHQDWVMKIDYNDGAGTGKILWRMGPGGDFTFSNIYNDPWPWFSHQHDAGMEGQGAGPLTIFDNGNTRVSPAPLGLGAGNSRGIVLTVDEANLQVTPVLSSDLGVYSAAMGSAQMLRSGTYFFVPAIVLININLIGSNSIEIVRTPGTANGPQVLNLEGPEHYRGWQMLSLYAPPIT